MKKVQEQTRSSTETLTESISSVRVYVATSVFLAIHATLIILVNVAYVFLKATGSSTVSRVIDVTLITFKLFWVNIVISRTVGKLTKQLKVSKFQARHVLVLTPPSLQFTEFQSISLKGFLFTFTAIFGPLVASAIQDANCFANALVDADDITTEYSMAFCADRDENFNCLGIGYGTADL